MTTSIQVDNGEVKSLNGSHDPVKVHKEGETNGFDTKHQGNDSNEDFSGEEVDYEYEEDNENEEEEEVVTDFLDQFLLPSSSYKEELIAYENHEAAMRGLNERWEIQLINTVEQSEEILNEQNRLSQEEKEILELRSKDEIEQAMSIAIENEEQVINLKEEHENAIEKLNEDLKNLQSENMNLTKRLKEHEESLQSAIELAINTVQKEMDNTAKEEKKTLIETFQSQLQHERRRNSAATNYLEQQLKDTAEASKAYKDENDMQMKEIIAAYEDKMNAMRAEAKTQQNTILQKQETKTKPLLKKCQKDADREYKTIIKAMKRKMNVEISKANNAYQTLLEIQSSQFLVNDEDLNGNSIETEKSNVESDAIENARVAYEQKLQEKLREKDAEHALNIQEVILNVTEKQRAIAEQNALNETENMDQTMCNLKITNEILEQDLQEARKTIKEYQKHIEHLNSKLEARGEIQEYGSLKNYWENASSMQIVGSVVGLNNSTSVDIDRQEDIKSNGQTSEISHTGENNMRTPSSTYSMPSNYVSKPDSLKEEKKQRSPKTKSKSPRETALKSKSPMSKSPKSLMFNSSTERSTNAISTQQMTPKAQPSDDALPPQIEHKSEVPYSQPIKDLDATVETDEVYSDDTEVIQNTSKPSSASRRMKKVDKENTSPRLVTSTESVRLRKNTKRIMGSKNRARDEKSFKTSLSSKSNGTVLKTQQYNRKLPLQTTRGNITSSPKVPTVDKHSKPKLAIKTKKMRSSVMSSSALSPTSGSSTKNARIMVLCMPLNAEIKQLIKKIGATLIENIENASSATHIVADGENGIRRTSMMMVGLCSTSNILHIEWLWECFKAGRILPCTHYLLLSDSKSERKFRFSMRQTLRNGQERRKEGGLLFGWKVFFCKDVAGRKAPQQKDLNLIVEAAGGTIISQSQLPLSQHDDPYHVLVITSDPPLQSQISDVDASKLKYEGAGSFTTTWLFDCILHQKLLGIKRGLGRQK